ncbi:hypothetical protein SO694_00001766 [Aureococcus anophagefferens]|uniref:Uncharacterized protein n=1 Tax=Aureococcus anophagefferens TaxID=44056 RepID=A0ABR1GBS5_AURAN
MDGAVGQRIQQKLATRRLASGENDAHAATKAAEKLHRRLARLAEKLEMSELATSEASSHVAELMKRGAGAPAAPAPPAVGAGAAARSLAEHDARAGGAAGEADTLRAAGRHGAAVAKRQEVCSYWSGVADLARGGGASANAAACSDRRDAASLGTTRRPSPRPTRSPAARRGAARPTRPSASGAPSSRARSRARDGDFLESKTTAWIRFAAEELALEVAAKAKAEPDDHRACCAVLQDALAVRRGLFPPARRDWAGDAALATTLADAARHRVAARDYGAARASADEAIALCLSALEATPENGDVAVALAAARVERAAVALADGDRPLAVACLADIESDAGLRARVSVAQNPRLRLAAGCLGDADGPPPPPPRLDFTFGCGCAPAFELPDFGLPRR